MATMTINPTVNQTNKSWNLTWKAAGRYPIVADRIYSTLAQAQAYVDDVANTASAIPGLVISVVDDTNAKNNGVYYVESIANNKSDAGFPIANKGVLKKVGGAETETAKNYSAALTLSQTLVTGQLIKVTEPQTITTGEGESQVSNTYKAGFYIVETPGTISALDTSTGAANEVEALKSRVDALEGNRVLVTDFNNYKTEVTNGLAAKADATTLTTHTTDTTIHVTAEDKAKWNNAESNANAKLAEEIAKLPSTYEAKGEASKAQTAAQGYADTAIATAVGAYAAEGVEASGLRKEIAASEAAAKSYADSVAAAAKSEAISAAGTALETALNTELPKKANAADVYTKGEVDTAVSGAQTSAEATAKAYVDNIVNDKTGEDGVITKGLNSRISDLEAIDHEKLATDASAAAVAAILDNAPESFDTLKEVADWIANNDHADDVATLMTDVENLKKIDHEAYKAADETNLAAAKTYADGLNTAMDTRVKVLEGQDVYVAETVTGQINAAEAAAKKYTDDEIAETIGAYTAEGVVASGLRKEIEDAKAAAIAKALEDATKALENYYIKSEVDTAISTAKSGAEATAKAYTDEVAGNYAAEGVEASGLRKEIAESSEVDQAYAKAYTDALFTSFKFAENADIDKIFTPEVTE